MNALGSSVKKLCVLMESCFSANFRSETLKYFKSYSRNKKNTYREYSSLYKPTKQSYFNLSWLLMRLVLKWPVWLLVRLLCKHLDLGNKIYPSFFKIHSLSAWINSDEKYCSCIICFKFFLVGEEAWSYCFKCTCEVNQQNCCYKSQEKGTCICHY